MATFPSSANWNHSISECVAVLYLQIVYCS